MGAITSSLTPGRSSGCKKTRQGPTPPHSKSFPPFVSSPVEDLHREFMKAACKLILNENLFYQKRRNEPPLRSRNPEKLQKLIPYGLKDEGLCQRDMIALFRKILYYSPKPGHPYYMHSLQAGLDPYSIIGDFVTSVCPSTMLTYRDGPVYHMMEQEISGKLKELIGYPEGSGDIIFPAGPEMGNVLSIVLARHNKFPESKSKGIMHLPQLCIFVSKDCHCSYQKGAIEAGIGLENVIYIRRDIKGKMSIPHLIQCIGECKELGKVPLMVGATSGTNVYGAFDSLLEIAKVCKDNNIWLHADASIGGGMMFSEKVRNIQLLGIDLCDSISGCFHKIGSASQTCAFLATRHSTILKETFGTGDKLEDYTSYEKEHCDEFFDEEMNTYHKYLEDTRRPDIVKLFFMWKAKGLGGLAANVDNAMEKAQFFLEELKRRRQLNGKFVPLLEEFESPIISFFYIPTYLQSMDRSGAEFKERLNIHTSFLQAELIKNCVMVITVQNLHDSPLFFKVSLHNSALANRDLVYLIDQIDNYGSYLRVPFELPHDVPKHDPEDFTPYKV